MFFLKYVGVQAAISLSFDDVVPSCFSSSSSDSSSSSSSSSDDSDSDSSSDEEDGKKKQKDDAHKKKTPPLFLHLERSPVPSKAASDSQADANNSDMYSLETLLGQREPQRNATLSQQQQTTSRSQQSSSSTYFSSQNSGIAASKKPQPTQVKNLIHSYFEKF